MNNVVNVTPISFRHVEGILELTRVFAAPREHVFDAWVQPQQFARWFGPRGASMPHCRIDLRIGGEIHFHMRVPGDVDVWCKGTFHDVCRPEHLAFAIFFSDEHGGVIERPGFPLETLIDVTFDALNGNTRLTVRQEGLLVDQGEVQGWREGFERLDALLEPIVERGWIKS